MGYYLKVFYYQGINNESNVRLKFSPCKRQCTANATLRSVASNKASLFGRWFFMFFIEKLKNYEVLMFNIIVLDYNVIFIKKV
jgi:hypothetical protein